VSPYARCRDVVVPGQAGLSGEAEIKASGRSSVFLKKRTKKLLRLRSVDLSSRRHRLGRNQTDKSFLVLFFKKEHVFPFT
jgi:hypothetical protein